MERNNKQKKRTSQELLLRKAELLKMQTKGRGCCRAMIEVLAISTPMIQPYVVSQPLY